MSKFRKLLLLIPILLLLAACKAGATPEPTAIPEEGNVFNPSAPPVQVWQEIPIMPEATAGEATIDMYGFKIDAEPDEIISYYRRRLPPFNWGEMYSLPYEEGMAVLIFTRGDRTLTITISDQDTFMLVLLQMQ